MIKVTNMNGARHFLHKDAIASVTDTSKSDQYFGKRAIVRTFDGEEFAVLECAGDIADQIEKAEQAGKEKP